MRQLLALLLATLSFPLSAAITGSVMTIDGKPVAGARVMIHAIETPEARRQRLLSASPDFVALGSTQTDAKGAFTLDSPKETVVDLRVELRGYEPLSRRIERDEDLGAIAISKRDMTKGSVTAGGKPVANALVVVSYGGDYITRTDEQGRYETPDIRRARGIVVIHPDFAIDDESFTTPNNTLASEANRTLTAGVTLTGRVVGQDGTSPMAKAAVFVDAWPLATSGDDGTFTVAHAPAKWSTVTARKETLAGSRTASANNQAPVVLRLEKSAVITGRITDVKTKLPVVGATVRLTVPRRPTPGDVSLLALTDAKGAYSIFAPAGSYLLSASHPAFETQMVQVEVPPAQPLVKDITVAQLARVSGVVIDEQQRPVVAASVSTENAGGDAAMMRMPMRMIRGDVTTISGPDGRFSVRVSADSDLRLKASKKGLPQAKGDSFRLAAGERKASVVLTIPTGVAVTGRVLDQNGDPLSGVAVSATETPAGRDGGMMVRRMIFTGLPSEEEDLVRSSSDGSFALRVKEGTYDFTFKREGYSDKIVRAQTVTANGAPPIEARLDPAVEITGRVTRGGTGVPDVMVSTFLGSDSMATTGPDGSFTLSGLTAGVTRVMISKPQELLNETRNITAPGRDVLIELPQGATISGRVVEKGTKKPVRSFSAGITTSRGGGGMMMMGPPMLKQFTADDGSFTLEHVPSGAVNLVANAPGYTSGRINLEVEEGKSLNDVVLELEQGARLVGRVTGSNGSPLADVSVSIQPSSASGGFAMRGSIPRTTTDANGEYVLDSVEPGEETVTFSHPKHVDVSKKVTIKGRDSRLDMQMSGGQRVTGVVVTDSGVPVPEAEVQAYGGGDGGETRTNAQGTFEFESMAPGRYRFSAGKAGYAQGRVEDFDISSGAPLRIVLSTGGTVYGRVTGLTEAELAQTSVNAYGSTGRGSGTSAAVDPQGNFRLEGVPEGTVRVSAQVTAGVFGSGRSSPAQTVEMTAGGSQQVNIDFRTDTVIRGRITRNGAPLNTATVQFWPRGGGTTSNASATADERGNYSVSGLEPGEYSVIVRDQRLSGYQTTYTVRGSDTFDIDYKTGMVRGRVLSAMSNDPVRNAMVNLKPISGDMRMTGYSASTDTVGTFSLDGVPAGSYRVLVTGEGFANYSSETTIGEQGREDLEIRLNRNEGIRLKVVDARDGRVLNANVVAFDMQGRLAHEGSIRFGGATEEEQTLQLAPGQYNATISVFGGSNYAVVHTRLTSPGTPTIYMSPGGSIRITSKHSERRKYYVLDSSGVPYPRWTERLNPRALTPGTHTLDAIAPGTYTIQLLNDNDSVTDQVQVTVREGQTVDASI